MAKRDDIAEYNRQWRAAHKDEYNQYCRERHARLKADPEYVKSKNESSVWARRKAKYGITKAEYEALLDEQRGCCVICGECLMYELRVDHDHETGEIRGLLCANCNAGLGMFKEDISNLAAAIDYLNSRKVN